MIVVAGRPARRASRVAPNRHAAWPAASASRRDPGSCRPAKTRPRGMRGGSPSEVRPAGRWRLRPPPARRRLGRMTTTVGRRPGTTSCSVDRPGLAGHRGVKFLGRTRPRTPSTWLISHFRPQPFLPGRAVLVDLGHDDTPRSESRRATRSLKVAGGAGVIDPQPAPSGAGVDDRLAGRASRIWSVTTFDRTCVCPSALDRQPHHGVVPAVLPTCSTNPSASKIGRPSTCVMMSSASRPNRSAGVPSTTSSTRTPCRPAARSALAAGYRRRRRESHTPPRALFQRLDDTAERVVDRHRIAGRLLIAGRSRPGRWSGRSFRP